MEDDEQEPNHERLWKPREWDRLCLTDDGEVVEGW